MSPIWAKAAGMPPARCPENTSPSRRRRRMVGRHRLLGPHVDRGQHPAVGDPREQGVVVDHRGPADQDQPGPRRQQVEFRGAQQMLALRRHGGQHEHEPARPGRPPPGLAGGSVLLPQHARPATTGRRPGSRASNGRSSRCRARPRLPKPTSPTAGPGQQDRVVVAVGDVALGADPEGPILAADAAGQIQGQPEGVLGDGLGVRGPAAEHVDAPGEAGLVVDVGEEVALDVEDGAQVRARAAAAPAPRSGCPMIANASGSASSSASGR